MAEKLLHQVKLLKHMLDKNLPTKEFAVVHSAWLALMGLRKNGDLDLLISTKLREQLFQKTSDINTQGLPGPYSNRIRFHPSDSIYGTMYGAKCIDDVIENYTVSVHGVKFIQPRFYFMYKSKRLDVLLRRRDNLPLWRRKVNWPLKSDRALRRKIKKDLEDFQLIINFFRRDLDNSSLKAVCDENCWGFPDCDWMPEILGSTELENLNVPPV